MAGGERVSSVRDDGGVFAGVATVFRCTNFSGVTESIRFVTRSNTIRRPQLAAALAATRAVKCPVIVSKLDRLSRDVAFISGLMAQRVPFIVA